MLFRNRMLGGVSFLPLFAPDDVAGAAAAGAATGGAAAGTVDPGAGAAAGAAAVDPAAAAAAAAAGTVDPGAATLAGGDGKPPIAAGPAKFPDDWRKQLAGGDAKAETDLAKYTDPSAIYKSLRELQGKVSSGQLKAPPAALAADATPEQKAEWRKSNGLPDTAEAYVKNLKLPDGLVIGAADKPLVEGFATALFEGGGTQAEMDRAVSWYYGAQDKLIAQQAEGDSTLKTASMQALMGEWGTDYKANMNAKDTVLALMPEDLRINMLIARTPDGRMLGNTAEFNKWLAQTGRELNPAATLVLPGADAGQSIADQIKTIEGKMYLPDGKENPEYWKGESGNAMQAKLRTLYDAQTKMADKGKAA